MRTVVVFFVLIGLAFAAGDPDPAGHVTPTVTPANPPATIGDAAALTGDADGPDNYTTGDFYGFTNTGTDPVTSITIDISIQTSSFWDFDGSATYQNGTAPIIGQIGGMSAADITWSYDTLYPHPQVLTATINPAMAPGAYFRFGADTDFFVSDPCPGGNFGAAPAMVTATFVSGGTVTEPYVQISTNRSEVTLGAVAFTLTVSPDPLVGGQTATFTAENGDPSTNTYLAYSLHGPGSTFVPFLNVTLDIAKPKQAGGVVVSDATGKAVWNLPIPAQAVGRNVWLQAVQYGNKTNVVATSII